LEARCAQEIADRIIAVGPENVAAFIGEPVQGAGGVIIPPDTYWPEIQRICDKYGILLVSDEVICGFGRLGEWFGCEKMGFRPDLMTFAKGVTSGYIPLGGVMVGDRVAEVLIEKGGEFEHGYTYSGHPVACALALENIEIVRREKLVETVREDTGPYLKQKFEALADHPLVGMAETCGLVAGLVLVKDKATREKLHDSCNISKRISNACEASGLLVAGDMVASVGTIVIDPLRNPSEMVDATDSTSDQTYVIYLPPHLFY